MAGLIKKLILGVSLLTLSVLGFSQQNSQNPEDSCRNYPPYIEKNFSDESIKTRIPAYVLYLHSLGFKEKTSNSEYKINKCYYKELPDGRVQILRQIEDLKSKEPYFVLVASSTRGAGEEDALQTAFKFFGKDQETQNADKNNNYIIGDEK